MKEEFVTYLDSIGVTKTAQSKIEDIHAFYVKVSPEEIVDIFVTEYVNDDGRREYENLWFFTESLVMEAKQFLTTDEYDMVPIKDSISRWEIKKQDYDFEQATATSRLSLEFSVGAGFGGISAELKASEVNCDYLMEIFRRFVITNLGRPHPVATQALGTAKNK